MAEIQVKDLIINAIKNKKANVLKELFETVPTIDIAEAMEDIEDVSLLIYPFKPPASAPAGKDTQRQNALSAARRRSLPP